ncbi:MAG: Ig-like domain-containing protein [Eubacteriales bacterium]|nr:Ig-like domain-containing protein [Eubacteriales bacterium]
MREMIKKKIALYLAVLLMLPAVLGALPMRTEAATELSDMGVVLQIEAGQEFYIGDYINVEKGSYRGMLSMYGGTYTTNKSSVASVEKKTGLVKAKKAGKATITAKYAGKSVKISLEVVKKGALGTTTTYKKINQAANKVAKAAKDDQTEALWNCRAYLKAISDYAEKGDTYIANNGVVWKDGKAMLVCPMGGRYMALYEAYTPLSTRSAKAFKPSKVTASVKKNTITVTLKDKVTETQLAVLYALDEKSTSKTKATFTCYGLYDATAEKSYRGEVSVKKGSKEMTIKLVNGGTGKRVKLVKGHKYKLMSKQEWLLGKTVTAK